MKSKNALFFLFFGMYILYGLKLSAQINDASNNMNGFDISNITIPKEEVYHGGPPKDGIPAIDNPKFVEAGKVQFLGNNDEVLAIYLNGVAKAYPIRILNYHEVVNDTFKKRLVIITFCPLCGSGVAFFGKIGDTEFTFGVSGLLYNNDVLLYDRQTESLWSQLKGIAVSGVSVGKEIELVAMEQTRWFDWKSRYPNSLVLDVNTGFARDYSRSPYIGYANNEQLYFPVNNENLILPKKEKVLGITIGSINKAYPFSVLRKLPSALKDSINGKNIIIQYKQDSDSAVIKDENNKILPATTLFWFAWSAFHPETLIYKN